MIGASWQASAPALNAACRAPVPAACGGRDKMILAAGSLLMILEVPLSLGGR